MKSELKIEVVDKNNLCKLIARRIGLTIIDLIQILNIFEEEIINAIKENKKVQLNGFLIFMPKDVKGGKIISPLDKKEYTVEDKRTVEVRVGKYFKDSIKSSYKSGVINNDSDKKSKRTKKSDKQD